MSPYCKQCLGLARPGEFRCPLDQQFYLRRDCPSCRREVYPRELYCAHCGSGLAQAPESLLLPRESTLLPMALGFGLDMLGVVLVVVIALSSLPLPPVLLAAVVLGLCYRTFARAQGRQSFGQAVFHQLTVSLAAGPTGYAQSARRTLGELVFLPLTLLRDRQALSRLDAFSASYEVTLG